ncbi:MAG: M14 family metallopeptidase, partial [Candidatus Aminicenantes bacterium]|nr:M14 family metallopeptidase [Candidatus Aminicenantes bacterium]
MTNKIRIVFKALSMALLLTVFFLSQSLAQEKLLTTAESSEFTATSRYDEVMTFIKKLQSLSSLVRVETLCISPEGREVPLLILGNPPPSSPQALNFDSRIVVYIQGNIHAGEVEGKEASLMLARDIILEKDHPFLDNLVVLFAPIFNADGNEKISPDNRRGQVGPENGAGVRYNGQNLDLNRDGIKLESPELQGLLQNVLNRWDPALLVDLHTTNGSYHEEPVTYSWPLNQNGDLSIINYMKDKMMPWISQDLQDNYDTLAIPYGNFMDRTDQEKGWQTYSHLPRYIANYVGLRNRLSILDENYS